MTTGLPPFVTAAEIAQASRGRFQPHDPELEKKAIETSSVIRAYCGWHVAPVIEKTYQLTYAGGGVLVLPTLKLVDVLSMEVDGVKVDGPEWDSSGEIRLPGRAPSKWRGVTVRIRHGFDMVEAASLRAVATQMALIALSSPTGATSERAGQVSITYAQMSQGVAGGLGLLKRDRDILDGYRLPERA